MPKDLGEDAGFQAYIDCLENGQEAVKSKAEIAESIGVSASTLYRWDKLVDWDAIKKARRSKYGFRMLRVDDAMFEAATKGKDVAAAKYLAERYDGYIQSSAHLNLNDPASPELVERAKAIREQLARAQQQGLGQAGVGDGQTGTA